MLALCLFVVGVFGAWVAADRVARGAPRWVLALPVVVVGAALVVSGDLFVLRKLAGRAAMPPGLVAFALVGLTGWALLRGVRRLGVVLALLTTLYWVGGNTMVGGWLLGGLEADYPPPDPAAVGRLDAVYVLGGGTTVRPDPGPALSYAGDRVFQAARWYLEGRTAVLATGGRSVAGLTQKGKRDLAAETAAAWQAMGVPSSAIVQVPGPRNTEEEMVALAQEAKARGWQRVGLVTSAWHLRRTMHHARRAGLEAVPIGADYRGRVPVPTVFAAVPSAQGLYKVSVALWEHLGLLVAR